MSVRVIRLLLLVEAQAANLDAQLSLAAEWKRDTGAEALWCLPMGTAAPPQLNGCGILEMPPSPTPGGAIWSVLCRALAAGATPLLVRAGTPGLGAAQLRQAQELLARHDAVFGITAHGCALVGLKRAVPELFAGIPWDSGQAMTAIRAQARRYRCDVAALALAPD